MSKPAWSRLEVSLSLVYSATSCVGVALMLSGCSVFDAVLERGGVKGSAATVTPVAFLEQPKEQGVIQKMVDGRWQFVRCSGAECEHPSVKVMAGSVPPVAQAGTEPQTAIRALEERSYAQPQAISMPIANPDVQMVAASEPVELLNLRMERELESWTVVYFGWASSDLSPQAQGVLNRTIEAAKSIPNAPILIAAGADSTGNGEKNLELIKARAGQVRGYLKARGLLQREIRVAELGALEKTGYLKMKQAGQAKTYAMVLPSGVHARARRAEVIIGKA